MWLEAIPWSQVSAPLIDTNECEGTSHLCAVNATCMNTRGSYNCMCNPGFEGDGFHNCSGETATDSTGIINNMLVRHKLRYMYRPSTDHKQYHCLVLRSCIFSLQILMNASPTMEVATIAAILTVPTSVTVIVVSGWLKMVEWRPALVSAILNILVIVYI